MSVLSGVDSSSSAIDLARENASLSQHGNKTEFVDQEVERFMDMALRTKQTWDIVILGDFCLPRPLEMNPGDSAKQRQAMERSGKGVKVHHYFQICAILSSQNCKCDIAAFLEIFSLKSGTRLCSKSCVCLLPAQWCKKS